MNKEIIINNTIYLLDDNVKVSLVTNWYRDTRGNIKRTSLTFCVLGISNNELYNELKKDTKVYYQDYYFVITDVIKRSISSKFPNGNIKFKFESIAAISVVVSDAEYKEIKRKITIHNILNG